MRYETRVERIGEWLGPVDWSYDFKKHGWPDGSVNPECIEEGLSILRELQAQPEGWLYCPQGFSVFPVVHVGMYDGWPFWTPTPAIGYLGPLGGVEISFWYSLRRGSLSRAPPPPGLVELDVVAVPGKGEA